MIFTEEDKARICKQVKNQWAKAKDMDELDKHYELYAVRFDQEMLGGVYARPSIAIIFRERTDEYGQHDPDGEWYYIIGWGSVSKSRGKWVFYRNDWIDWCEAGGSAWEGNEQELEELMRSTRGLYPNWEHVILVEE